ncbi:retinol dehydrogenase 14-like isoform X2 [Belonocnema kinseyi]|uniref:retinol dehydrogenase 14-like isoform X2 n=1 Tax=Belonocnema kinseyi TaxID=2817044 RepID=UPI00143DCF31|nr:retinol dehydrogenase 14-like isoform X2 [Belonocnema kinseyi]
MFERCKRNRRNSEKFSGRLECKVTIITGSNSGIGKATALDFAKRGARVIMACRNLAKANVAKEEIVKLSGNENVVVRHVDLASLRSVRNFAQNIISTEDRLHVLVNNAGIAGVANIKSEDDIDLGLQVNHYAPFLLTNLLIDLLRKSAPSRIIHVSSKMHKMGSLDFDNMNCEKGMNILTVYVNSKLYNVIGSNEIARRLEGTGVTSNSLHPGVIRTEIYQNFNAVGRYLLNKTCDLFFKTAEQGAQTTIYLAVSDEVANCSGRYFKDCKNYWFRRTGQHPSHRIEKLAKFFGKNAVRF